MTERQPYLHDQVGLVAAPAQWWSGHDGDISDSGVGLAFADVSLIDGFHVTFDGESPTPIAHNSDGRSATFTSVVRHLQDEHLDGADPRVTLTRHRTVMSGRAVESFRVESHRSSVVNTQLRLDVMTSLSPVDQVKHGQHIQATPELVGGTAVWSGAGARAVLTVDGAALEIEAGGISIKRSLAVRPGDRAEVVVTIELSADPDMAPMSATTAAPVRIPPEMADLDENLDPRLSQWLARAVSDLQGLRLEHRAIPGSAFFAAGAPWYLTLFGRDSLWASWFTRHISPATAISTLHVLAEFQGRDHDADTEEAPGKIVHEIRSASFSLLPARYYGTIDATCLWVGLLVDLWRDERLNDPELWLPPLEAALRWVVGPDADPDGDGFLEYVASSDRHKLTNQGWKDSSDAVKFANGARGQGPIALCEVQAYAYRAAKGGAALLRAIGSPAQHAFAEQCDTWAGRLRQQFSEQFLLPNGLPALALDGAKKRVDSTTSNMGHLLGTGILDAEHEHAIADRLLQQDMSSGLGLRTMSSLDRGYNPLSYHCGTVWAHDTAITIQGLCAAGLHQHAQTLSGQLLRAAEYFEYHLPELWSGHEGHPVPYPAACRPQAWAAAAAFPAIRALAATG